MGSVVSDQRYVAIKCRRFVLDLIEEPDQPSASYVYV